MADEIIDSETGEIVTQPSLPAARYVGMPTPYQSAETGQIAEALAAAQGEMESPKRVKEVKIEGTTKAGRSFEYKYSYAPLEELHRVIKDVFPKYGLMHQQGLVIRGEQYFMRTYIRHVSGEWTASDYPVIADKSGPQGFASAATTARRYGLGMAIGLAPEDDDDAATAQRAAPDLKPLNDDTQLAREALRRLRQEIAEAAYVEELDVVGIHGVSAEQDRDLIERQKGGPQAWADLVSRDRKRRDEISHLGGNAPFERDYRI